MRSLLRTPRGDTGRRAPAGALLLSALHALAVPLLPTRALAQAQAPTRSPEYCVAAARALPGDRADRIRAFQALGRCPEPEREAGVTAAIPILRSGALDAEVLGGLFTFLNSVHDRRLLQAALASARNASRSTLAREAAFAVVVSYADPGLTLWFSGQEGSEMPRAARGHHRPVREPGRQPAGPAEVAAARAFVQELLDAGRTHPLFYPAAFAALDLDLTVPPPPRPVRPSKDSPRGTSR